MRKNAPQPISDVLQSVVEELSRVKKKDIFKIVSAWPALVGKELSRHSRPASLRKGTLQVFVDESAWLYQINFQKGKLLKALQKKIGPDKVQKIQFRIGKS